MKKLSSLLVALTAILSAWAVTPQDLIIYINPGHGGHDSDDRNVVIAPYEQGDPEGFWESNSNLDKGLLLRDLLLAEGFTVKMSRVTNTSDDDLGLSTIGYLANAAKADFFFSIHSNATGTSSRVNFPLMLFRGYDNEPVRPNAKTMANLLGAQLYDNGVTVWTNNYQVRGDWSFYTSWGTSGLGVLRSLAVDGMLSEGSFHDYIPETYRLMNTDFKYLEAWHFLKAIHEYFGLGGGETGLIIGRINDSRFLRNDSYYKYGDDELITVDGAKVELFDAGENKIAEYVTDNLCNGVYAFRNVAPGTYKIKATEASHYAYEGEVTVEADKATYNNIKMVKIRNTPPVVESYSPVWKEGDNPVLCNTPIVFTFNWDMDRASTEAAFSISPAVEGEFIWTDSNYTLTFKPTNPYAINTEYTVKLDNTAEHAGGLKLENPLEFKFFTLDRNFMEMLGHYPKENDKVHYSGAYVELRFDKHPNVVPILTQLIVTDSQGKTVNLNTRSWKYSKTGDPYGYLRIPFASKLTIGEKYHMSVSKELADKDGITLQDGYEMDFTAVDASVDEGGQIVIDSMDDAKLYALNEAESTGISTVTVGAGGSSMKLLGTNSLKIAYTLSTENEAQGEVAVSRTEAAAETITNGQTLTVRVYGDLTNNELYAQFTSETAVKYIKIKNLNFLGWEYIEVPMTELEGSAPYSLTGFKIVENPTLMSKKGTIYIDNIAKIGDSGVDAITIDNITVHPNPASEYVIANGDALVKSMELTSMSGQVVAQNEGNYINVSNVPEGTYLVKVTMASGLATVKKIIVKH